MALVNRDGYVPSAEEIAQPDKSWEQICEERRLNAAFEGLH